MATSQAPTSYTTPGDTAPLIEACRPKGKTPPHELRRTVEAIFWRHQNRAKWRSVPAGLGPWWRTAQLFIRWSRLGVWGRLLAAAQARGVELGMAFLDGTSVRAHQKAAGAAKRMARPVRKRHPRPGLVVCVNVSGLGGGTPAKMEIRAPRAS